MLQSHTVFANVSKGQVAKTDDMKRAFDSVDMPEVCLKVSSLTVIESLVY